MHFTYCPYCGKKLVEKEYNKEVLPCCETCHTPFWDMFSTAAIIAVINEYDELALIKQEYVSDTHYVCNAGIVKLGETVEDRAVKEVMEEIGHQIESLDYIHSFFFEKKQHLMIGFRGYVKKKDFVLSEDVDDAIWVPVSEALDKLKEGSVAWRLVKRIIDEQYC